MGRLEAKTAIVTGGAKGLGKATCILMAKEGANVAMLDIDKENGISSEAEIKRKGGSVKYYYLDVTSEENIKEVFAQIFKDFGSIDVLVNNAGITGIPKETHGITVEEWDEVINVDARGVFFCTKHAIPYMKKSGRGGSIVNISSVYGIVAGIDNPPPYLYHAAKGAVRLMSKSDAICYARDGIRVNSVHPGWIWTPMLAAVANDYPRGPEAFNKEFLSLIPLGHWGEPNDVANGILFLASDDSKFITGSELVIDGGYIAR